MAPRKRPSYDEYIPPTQPAEPVVPPKTIQERHTSYESRQPPARSFITVPLPSALPSMPPPGTYGEHPTIVVTPSRQMSEGPRSDIDADDAVALAEELDCELEAVGLGKVDNDLVQRTKRQRTHSDNPLLLWVLHIDTYVDEFLWLEGRGDAVNQVSCAQSGCENDIVGPNHGFRCQDCHFVGLFCTGCLLNMHIHLPFHRISKWNGTHFEKTCLKDLGLRVQLGHPLTGKCTLPEPAFNDSFVVIDSDGVHEINLDYCGCQQSIPKTIQLLRARLFPSTVIDPKTAATFRVLETFQMLTFMSKASGFEFYRALSRRTDNTGTCPPPDRYHAFMRIVREWRHVRLLKRAGRGHSSTGVQGTQQGECAVVCPACPLPGINLPNSWERRPLSEQWLYSLFIGIDANFRLKRMNVSNDARDPGLNHGYAYIVEEEAFKTYLDLFNSQIPDDKSTCTNHDAIKSASIRGGRGTAASGLGTVECSRHDMKRPMAVGDLQKGEHYVNMDYFFLSSLRSHTVRRIVVSYDIACQWSKNLRSRCNVYPPNTISSSQDLELVFLVPKFHLPAHIIACQLDYSFNLVPGVGRTDGEAPERGWASANAVAASTKEMGPGSRRDVLDDYFGDYNWRKIIAIGIPRLRLPPESFVRKSKDAIAARQEHVEGFIEFDVALPPASTAEWTKLCHAWEADRTKTNPFRIAGTTISDAEVRLQLAEEDEAELSKGSTFPTHFSITPSFFIYQGLEIEDQQRRLENDVSDLGAHSTSLKQAKVLERSNTLRRKIDAWIEIQHFYLPALVLIRAQLDEEGGGKPIAVQNIDLFLPSQIYDRVTYPLPFLQYEWQFRYARAKETLSELRGQLLRRSMMYKSKERHSRGQRQQTRSIKLIESVSRRINASAKKYRSIREALVSLAMPLVEVSWVNELHSLEDSDLTGLTSLDDGGPEGRKKLTWIWTVQGTGADADISGQEALRVEWCKARARAHRWQEECLLLQEEMRRVLATFRWQAENWRRLAHGQQARPSTSSHTIPSLALVDIAKQEVIKEGKIAYAHRQATIRDQMVAHCEAMWSDIHEGLERMDSFDPRVMIEHNDITDS